MFSDVSVRAYEAAFHEQATAVIPLQEEGFSDWLAVQPLRRKQWVENVDFRPRDKKVCMVPGAEGELDCVLVGTDHLETEWSLGQLPAELPAGEYRIEASWEVSQLALGALAWSLGSYRFERYKTAERRERPILILDPILNGDDLIAQMRSVFWVRDLINTPAADMMPEDLSGAAREIAALHGAEVKEIIGHELLDRGFPAIHAVGRASAHAPRFIELTWGETEDRGLVLVGKGVCFDSGGLDLKPAAGMRLMKKDMGGAAHVLGLASMIMDRSLPVRLTVLIPAVENAVSGDSYRPGDVVTTRSGKTIEIDNTDAEGRVVLSDALTEAINRNPELIVDFATLTGAARVALGTEVPAFFTNSEAIGAGLTAASDQVDDPVWRLPLHRPYRALIDSPIADIVNSAEGPYGGAITAALFLQEFVSEGVEWLHLDLMGWNSRDRPGRPKGGEAMGLRSVFHYLKGRFGKDA